MTNAPPGQIVVPAAGLVDLELMDGGRTVAVHLETASGECVSVLLPKVVGLALAARLQLSLSPMPIQPRPDIAGPRRRG